MTRPTARDTAETELPSLVTTLSRVATGLRETLIAVESGEFSGRNSNRLTPLTGSTVICSTT